MSTSERAQHAPPLFDRVSAAALLAGLAALYLPSLWDLFNGIWASDQQGHGPIILGLSIWLLWSKRAALAASEHRPSPVFGCSLLLLGLLLFLVGRTQEILLFEIGSAIVITAAILLLFKGPAAIKVAGFPLFFMLFMVPLPGAVVDALTQPMKTGVSIAAEYLLHTFNYPISRSVVLLQIGQYQLLVADACAGLHTLFTLEALGLLYLNLVRHNSMVRNVMLAICIVPISFSANVIRVVALTLITYYFGDEVGQGFLHGFAGMVLFMAALLLITAADGVARWVAAHYGHPAPVAPTPT